VFLLLFGQGQCCAHSAIALGKFFSQELPALLCDVFVCIILCTEKNTQVRNSKSKRCL